MIPPRLPSREMYKTEADRDQGARDELPAIEVAIVRSSEQSMSSIGIGEFGMNTSKKGNTTTFAMAVREHLFQMVKFLGGTNTSLDYSTRPHIHLRIDENALQHCRCRCMQVVGTTMQHGEKHSH